MEGQTKPKKLYTTAPSDFAVCTYEACPKAAECLHRMAYQERLEDPDCVYMRLLNPAKCNPDGDCTYFRNAVPVRYARGFKKVMEHMYRRQYMRFSALLEERFGRTGYYNRRRGDMLLSPVEQEVVRQALRQSGVTEEMTFDSYENGINWYD